jgi:hypothetical protein
MGNSIKEVEEHFKPYIEKIFEIIESKENCNKYESVEMLLVMLMSNCYKRHKVINKIKVNDFLDLAIEFGWRKDLDISKVEYIDGVKLWEHFSKIARQNAGNRAERQALP